jgi:glucosylceramidase
MQKPRNRREFLKSSALGIAALRSTAVLGKSSGAVASNPAGPLSVWITEGNRRLEKQTASKWENSHGAPGAESIVIDPAKSYQPILGFGAAFTDAACYTFNRLGAGVRETLFHELFHPSDIGLSVCRTCVGSSDYSTEAFTYNEGDPDPDLKRFSIEHDRPYVLPILRQARKLNPDLFLFSSPWTPPGWMKSNKSMLGGNMQRHYMASYRSPLNEQLRDCGDPELACVQADPVAPNGALSVCHRPDIEQWPSSHSGSRSPF